MRVSHFAPALCALAFGLAAIAAPVQADDPNDPTMATRAARARDRAQIRKLNEDQLAYVRQRDAHYAEGWDAYRRAHRDDRRSESRSAREEDADYAAARDDYEDALAQWRHDVAACRAGDYAYCDRR